MTIQERDALLAAIDRAKSRTIADRADALEEAVRALLADASTGRAKGEK